MPRLASGGDHGNMAGRGTDIALGGNPRARAWAEVDPHAEPGSTGELLLQYRAEATAERERP